MLAPYPNPKLEYHPLSAILNYTFNRVADTLHTWSQAPPDATWGRGDRVLMQHRDVTLKYEWLYHLLLGPTDLL